ncbi:MAG: hypothetical protein WCB27_08375 [Thermoguttaceae bacterium]
MAHQIQHFRAIDAALVADGQQLVEPLAVAGHDYRHCMFKEITFGHHLAGSPSVAVVADSLAEIAGRWHIHLGRVCCPGTDQAGWAT